MWRIRFLLAACLALGGALSGVSNTAGSSYQASIAPAPPGTTAEQPGPGKFLVARRSLDGSLFGQTVVYLVEHDENGTLGLIVNRASRASLSEAIPDLEDEQAAAHRMYYGGPVGIPVIFMLLRGDSVSEGLAPVVDDVYFSMDRRVLEAAIAAKRPADEVRFYIGYSGWGAGQLDSELARDDWHVATADTDAIFSGDTQSLWDRLIERLEPPGIQVNFPGNQWLPKTLAL